MDGACGDLFPALGDEPGDLSKLGPTLYEGVKDPFLQIVAGQ